jgi:hypothetical protein
MAERRTRVPTAGLASEAALHGADPICVNLCLSAVRLWLLFASIRVHSRLVFSSRSEIIFDLGFSHFDVFPGHTEPDPVPGVVHVPFKIPHAFGVFMLRIRS